MRHLNLLQTMAALWERDQATADLPGLVIALRAPHDVVRTALQELLGGDLIEIVPDSPLTLVDVARLRLTRAGWDTVDEVTNTDLHTAMEDRHQAYLAAEAQVDALEEHPGGIPEVTMFPTLNGALGDAMEAAELAEYRYGRAVERYQRGMASSG